MLSLTEACALLAKHKWHNLMDGSYSPDYGIDYSLVAKIYQISSDEIYKKVTKEYNKLLGK